MFCITLAVSLCRTHHPVFTQVSPLLRPSHLSVDRVKVTCTLATRQLTALLPLAVHHFIALLVESMSVFVPLVVLAVYIYSLLLNFLSRTLSMQTCGDNRALCTL